MGSPLPHHKPRELTQGEEIAYWQGYDAGRAEGSEFCVMRYVDDGLAAAHAQGWQDGWSKRMGVPWDHDDALVYRPKGAQNVAT